ncbi:MAG: ferredoxin [Gemmatimonadota bacterium]
MAATHQDQVLFHTTGKRTDEALPIDAKDLRPALLAGYRDLTRLRYDYPLVLIDDATGTEFALPLSVIIDRLLSDLAPRGIEGERLRRHVLRLERAIREQVAHGTTGILTELWAQAATRIAGRDAEVEEVLRLAAAALKFDGEVVDCDGVAPARVLMHAWRAAQADKARRFRAEADRMMRKLTDILRAAHVHSEAGQRPEALRATVGGADADAFDFGMMSKLISRNTPRDQLPPARRQRIEWALSVLRAQGFYPDPNSSTPALEYCFDNCAAVVAAYRERLRDMVQLVKAMAIAELEGAGRYVEDKDDAFFARFDERALTAAELALFPDYLVCIPAGRNDAPENAGLLDMLSSGLPVKVLVLVDDLLEDASIGTGHFAFGVRSARLATMAMGLGGMFVLQSPGSNLYSLRERIARGLICQGPALFAVFAGTTTPAAALPPYLTAAAAMDSRAFPAFSYDAAAGENWAARFSLENNPAPDADWRLDSVEYADEALQRASEPAAFTFADFALCDMRYAGHFALVPRERWNGTMIPAADWLRLSEHDAAQRVPYLLAVDGSDVLHRVVVDARMMAAMRRSLLLWHRLQEHGGVHDSHAERLLAREKAAWEAQKQKEIEALRGTPQPAPAATTPAVETAAAAPVATEAAPEKPPSDEAWIETARCPSCGECTTINDRMFAYNDNKQAYIKDIAAGTFKQLVEAAESCQVAIIHPGKPRDPNEPGLAELIERAKPFQ